MFSFLPYEVNCHIYSFFNKQTLTSAALVSKLSKSIVESEHLLMQLLGINSTYFPKQLSARKIYQIFHDLFKLPGNNFCTLMKNNGLDFNELYQSLKCIADRGVLISYLYCDKNISPPMMLCPLSFPLNTSPGSLTNYFLMAGKKLPEDFDELKKEFSTLKFNSISDSPALLEQDTNCFVIFCYNKDLADFKEAYNFIKQSRILNNKPMPFVIPVFYSSLRYYKKPVSDPMIQELIKHFDSLPENRLKKFDEIGGIDKVINALSIYRKEVDEFTPQINTLSLPITATICDLMHRDSKLWSKLTKVISSIEKAALMLDASYEVIPSVHYSP